jgi:hypothetical protein
VVKRVKKKLIEKKIDEEKIKSFFEASDIPSQCLFFWELILLNNCIMCDEQDIIKNRQRNLVLSRSKKLEVETP